MQNSKLKFVPLIRGPKNLKEFLLLKMGNQETFSFLFDFGKLKNFCFRILLAKLFEHVQTFVVFVASMFDTVVGDTIFDGAVFAAIFRF